MRDPNATPELRIRAAQVAAPFIHSKPGTTRSSDPAANAKLMDDAHGFIIEPVLARAIRDDIERLSELRRHGGRLSDAEEQEDSRIRERIAETAKAIGCPVGYGATQARKDRHRLTDLFYKRLSPPPYGRLTDAEDAEEAQLTARIAAFDETPEGLARGRIRQLRLQRFRSTAEQNELESLRQCHPDLPPDPDDPLKEFKEAWQRDVAMRRSGEVSSRSG
jgi:hypothetical protein